MFGILKPRLTYEHFGYSYGDVLLRPFLDGMLQTHIMWTGRASNPLVLGRGLAILGLSAFQVCLLQTVRGEDAQSHPMGGLLRRLTEDYDNFAFDPTTANTLETYTSAFARDHKSPATHQSYPTVTSVALAKIAMIGPDDPSWHEGLSALLVFINNAQLAYDEALKDAIRHNRLVVG